MQILMSEAAHARVRGTLHKLGADLEVITADLTGAFSRDGVAIDAAEVDPEVIWLSLDLYKTPLLAAFFGRMMQGKQGQVGADLRRRRR